MEKGSNPDDDSAVLRGGVVPGTGGQPAWYLRARDPSALPVLIAVPHAGRAYPGALLERMRNPSFAALRLEDRYVDLIGEAVARETGAALLVAEAPRAMIDLNRAVDDVDWSMFGDRPLGDLGSYAPGDTLGRRARSGLGLIPRRLPGIGELWKRRHDSADLAARIAGIHEPYHRQLGETLAALQKRWGATLLLDLHSMPPLGLARGEPGPEFVLGDRFGAACDGSLVATAFAQFAQGHRSAAYNRPYAGGYVLERHAAPRRGLHALQIEIDRSRYLDERLAEPGPGFDDIVATLVGLVRCLAREVASRGAAGWAEAAE